MHQLTYELYWSAERMFRNTAKLLGGNISLILLQALQFILLARTLGASVFGEVAIVTSMVAWLIPLSDIGAGQILQRYGAVSPSSLLIWFKRAITSNLASGTILVVVVLLVLTLLYPNHLPPSVILPVAATEFLLLRMVWIAGQFNSALEKFGTTAIYMLLSAVCKLAGAVLLFVEGSGDPAIWAIGTMTFAFILAIAVIPHTFSRARSIHQATSPRTDWRREAFAFSLSDLSRSTANELDKVLLGRIASATILGPYTAAYRLTGFALAPVRALVQANRTRIYRSGAISLKDGIHTAAQVLKVGLPISILASVGLLTFAPIAPYLLGDTYSSSPTIIRSLAFLPILQLLSLLTGDLLASLGQIKIRLIYQAIANILLFSSGLILISEWGWRGAVIACYTGELTLTILSIVFLLKLNKQSRVRR